MLNKLSLKWKIFTFLLGFSSLLLLVLWLFQTVFLSDMYKLIRKSEINKAVVLVEQNIDSPNLYNILKQLDEEKAIFVVPANEFTAPTNPMPDDKNRPRSETLTQVKEFVLQDGKTLSLTFHAMITPVNATITTLQMQLYLITVIMLLLSVLLALLISGRISRPIINLNNSAKLLAKGKYETHFSAKGFLEITELSDTLNLAANELSKVENLRRELMANISHDLRTPLALIYSYAEMMHDFPMEITPAQTQIIMDETKRLTSLVNDVLDVSQLQTGWVELNLQKYNVSNSIKETTNRMATLLKKDGYEIIFEYDKEIVINADEVKITQVFYNLLLNAINYSGDDKKVTIRQTVIDDYIKIEIIDSGDGIASEDLPYIWDRYYKVDKHHKRSVTGTGLGLSIVKKILDLHHAEYGVESTLGGGSNFWFKLKIA